LWFSLHRGGPPYQAATPHRISRACEGNRWNTGALREWDGGSGGGSGASVLPGLIAAPLSSVSSSPQRDERGGQAAASDNHMPWTANEAERHTHKASTPALQNLWAKVANETLERTGDDAQAIREANAVVSRQTDSGR
jgi:hypothetical protein